MLRAVPAPILVIVNPRSRSGATGRRIRAVEAKLRAELGPLEVEETRGPRDAERIAREAVRAGVEKLIVAGGDGTTSEVVSGLLGAGLGARAKIGLLPLGTGGDLVRTLGAPRELDAAIARLRGGKERRLDAGEARFRDRTGAERRTHFLNVASAGVSGLVCELVNEAPKSLGGTLSFLLGTLRAIARFAPRAVSVRVDSAVAYEGPLSLAVAANGRYFGGGMHVAPRALPDDGLLDVVLVRGLSKPHLLWRLPLIYAGAHLDKPECRFTRGRVVEIAPAPGTEGELRIELDGEPLGGLPARFEALPRAVTLFGVEG
jgi:YegS/Rv2252/BmrU family lipid kinase